MKIAIVGLGPWGICALERIVTTARGGLRPGLEVEVHIVEPEVPGSGVYDVSQPDYLLLNNPCGQLSLYPFADEDYQPCYNVGLFDWAVEQGYRWVGDRCVIDPSGTPIEPHHFLPRRLMGEYLQWFYHALVAGAPSSMEILYHPWAAVDIVGRRNGCEEVRLENGRTVVVDQVIVTSGHTANASSSEGRSRSGELSPYPVTAYVDRAPAGTTIGVSGMGLVALDVVTALTLGRGGQFVNEGTGLRYRPSGDEPVIHMFSRSGLPFTAKSVTGSDLAGAYDPVICTEKALDALSRRSSGGRRLVNVRIELLPLMFAEMYVRYYTQVAIQQGANGSAAAVGERLRAAWEQGRLDQEVAQLRVSYGHFDAEALFFGHQPSYDSSADYERYVYTTLADDLREAEVPNGASPIKAASEVFRIFRDPTRSVVEQGGLSLDSYLDFNADIRSRLHRLVAGPPALRFRQLLALMDAGLLRTPYGPAPAVGTAAERAPIAKPRTRISSTAFEQPYAADVDLVVRGRLDGPRVDGSASQLLSGLYNRGRVSQFRYGAVKVGSVDLTPESHPIDVDGRAQERLWMFGVLTEGIRHFTTYIPSPKSRIRAFEDLGACAAEILC
ncbi:MAG: FAD/NAD(P)-binding protein [Solirubrobacteraceae bacterium]